MSAGGVLHVHNRYQCPGGEDSVVDSERNLLLRSGYEVTVYDQSNDRLRDMSWVGAAGRLLWSIESFRELRACARRARPRVAHFHNTFPLISPSGYHAVRGEGVAVVQTLHNYRLFCPGGTCFRNTGPCQVCNGRRLAWPGIWYRCYRRSAALSAAVASMTAVHRVIGTWDSKVDVFVCMTEFARRLFIGAGLPEGKLVVKPNFLNVDPGRGKLGDYALFVGRLSDEKGIRVVLRAWEELGRSAPRLVIVGDGPLRHEVAATVQRVRNVEWRGWLSKDEVVASMKTARVLIVPSLCYEGFPMTIVEALAIGLPVVASRIGGLAEIVRHGQTGLLFEPGNWTELASIAGACGDSRSVVRDLSEGARRDFEQKYTADRARVLLGDIYALAEARI